MPGSSLNDRRRPKGIAVRPKAVRQARLESGLSLAELAGGEVTRAAIHLVETGKMRPSMRTLQLIAQRTGRPISYFMIDLEGSGEQRGARDEVVQLLDQGEYQAAIAMGGRLLNEPLEPGIEADVRFAVGRAHVSTIDGEKALRHLVRARQLFERIGDAWMAVHVLVQEGIAMFLIEDPRALPRALDALERCDRQDPPDAALRASVFNLIGSIYLRSYDWRNAARFFAMGLQACENVVSIRQVARLNDGLSLAQQRLGDFGGALRAAERAASLYGAELNPTGLIRAENNLGYVLLRQGELDAAGSHLNHALELCDRHDIERRTRTYVLNSIGELHLARGDARTARSVLQDAIELSVRLQEGDSEALARHLLARAHARLGDDAAADRAFVAAVELFRQLRLPERLRECAIEYAERLHGRGRLEESIGYWRTAATAGAEGLVGSRETAALLRQTGA